MQGTFYEPELQRVTVDDDTLGRIEKVLKRRVDQWYVQWKGWPRKYNSWIRRQDLAPWPPPPPMTFTSPYPVMPAPTNFRPMPPIISPSGYLARCTCPGKAGKWGWAVCRCRIPGPTSIGWCPNSSTCFPSSGLCYAMARGPSDAPPSRWTSIIWTRWWMATISCGPSSSIWKVNGVEGDTATCLSMTRPHIGMWNGTGCGTAPKWTWRSITPTWCVPDGSTPPCPSMWPWRSRWGGWSRNRTRIIPWVPICIGNTSSGISINPGFGRSRKAFPISNSNATGSIYPTNAVWMRFGASPKTRCCAWAWVCIGGSSIWIKRFAPS